MNIDEYARKLRELLGLTGSETEDDILSMIRAEGWEPNLISNEVDGKRLWACPVTRGIFGSVQVDEATGRTGHVGSLSPEIALLEGLRRTRFIPQLQAVWEYVSKHQLSEQDVSYAGQDLHKLADEAKNADGSMSLVIAGSAPPEATTKDYDELRSWLTDFIKGLKPRTAMERYTLLAMIGGFLAWVASVGLSSCQGQHPQVLIEKYIAIQMPFDSLK